MALSLHGNVNRAVGGLDAGVLLGMRGVVVKTESLEPHLEWRVRRATEVNVEYAGSHGWSSKGNEREDGHTPDAGNRQTQPTFLPCIHSPQQGMFLRLPEKICPKDKKNIERFFKITGSTFLSSHDGGFLNINSQRAREEDLVEDLSRCLLPEACS